MTKQEKAFLLPRITDPDVALQSLKDGNRRFVIGERSNQNIDFDRRKILSEEGQSPHTIILSCADSRLPPTRVFDQALGDLFVLRIAGNILSAEEIGSMEFAVEFLESCLIVIMGHQGCGAVTAAVEYTLNPNIKTTKNIDTVMNRLKVIVNTMTQKHGSIDKNDLVEACIDENIENGLVGLLAQSDLIVDKIRNNKVKVVGAKYLLGTGEVTFKKFHSLPSLSI